MELESVSTTISAEEMSDSPSSLAVEPSISDSQEQLTANENTEKDEKVEEERKVRRHNRRLALAMAKCPLPAPKLGKVLTSANTTIDLTCEDDDPNNKWFKKTFAEQLAAKNKSPEGVKQFAVPRNGVKTYLRREDMKKQLQASMSAKRQKEQEQRRKMYEEDNEHLKPSDDEEEEEEEQIVRKKKTLRKEDEYDSEDDEDYKPPENGLSDEEKLKDDDGMSVNFLNDSFTYDVFNNVKRPGPGSTISNFDTRSQTSEQMVHADMGGSNDMDLLALCSGNFEGGGASELPDTLAMLLEGEKKSARKEKAAEMENVNVITEEKEEEDEEEDDFVTKKKTKTSRIVDSDEEDEEVEETPQQVPSVDIFASEEVENSVEAKKDEEIEEIPKARPSRIVLSGDEDSEDELEDQEDEEVEEDVPEEEEEENPEEEEEDVAEEAPDVPEPDFDDEDDELAVLKRIEHQEYKQKIKKKTLFDDEASLSGDDVGSDVEDDEGVNDYEAEEGDADDVPDDDTIRRQNYKLLLKQENEKEHRALAKLQDKLLADGDLGGVETNRQFRFKLREEVEIQMGDMADQEDGDQDDEPEEDENKKKERAEMIKYKIEHAEELMLLDEPDDDDSYFRRAGKMIKTAMETRTVVETSEEVLIKNRTGKPSLLSKTSLAVSFQEVLAGGGPVAKQMYVQNFNSSSSTSSGGATSSTRLSSGGVKRGRQSPDQNSSKRVKQSKLGFLE